MQYTNKISEEIYTQALLNDMGHTMGQLMVAWAQQETNNYTSKFAKKYNNLYGYTRDMNSRYQNGSGTIADNGQKIATYFNYKNSIKEVIEWMNRRYKKQDRGTWPKPNTITTAKQLARLLKQSKYYHGNAIDYAKRLEYFINNINKL